jgi:hypothetical protein
LSASELIVEHLQHEGEKERGMSLVIHGTDGRIDDRLLHTEAWHLELGAVDPAHRAVYFFGYRRGHRDARLLPENVGAWRLDLTANGRLSCIANEAPAGGTVAVMPTGVLFADASVQTPDSSRLVFAGASGHHAATTNEFLREFAVEPSGRGLLCKHLGSRFAIRRFRIDELVRSSPDVDDQL